MAYRRTDRRTWYSEVRTREGWKQMAWHVRDKRLAAKMEIMWRELAEKHRAWDVLGRVLESTLDVRDLFDLWELSGHDVHAVRAKLEDVNLADFLPDYLRMYGKTARTADTKAKVRLYLASLCGEGKPLSRSACTPDHLTSELYKYDASPSTIRKVHSAWSGFFAYLVEKKRLLAVNPMANVERPVQKRPPVQFYESEVVERIIGAQPTEERRALYALIYGTGMDVTPAVELRRSDIQPDAREVRCMGTKAASRDRVVRVADWAWDLFWPFARMTVGTARVFPRLTRWTASDWHRETVATLDLGLALPLRCARHHWAVRALRSGTPVQLVADQMGHANPYMTLRIYGRFASDAKTRTHWEREAAEYEARRRAGNDNE